jgi:hypothetical protein
MLFRRWKTKRNDPTATPPGVVVNYISARTGKYIGSPSIAVLPNGDYIASHDYFRKNKLGISPQNELLVFGSRDKGATWQKRAELKGFWHNLFTHGDQGALYLMGPTKEYGHVIIRRSNDSGYTWTEPADRSTGRLLDEMEYHTAPVPMLVHNNRIWRAMEETENGRKEWAKRFGAFVMSAPVDSQLLDANNWTTGNRITPDEAWLGGDFGGWLEGNVVLAPDGNIVNILRVETPGLPEKAAIITMNPEGGQAAFDPDTGFVDFPGGAKKFNIRYDPHSGFYWALINPVKPEFKDIQPIAVRNTLALSRSADLRTWEIRSILLEHPDPHQHGFQYVDWLFDGDDIIAAVRTAFDDPIFGANSAHNANYLTFHRFVDFRNL